MKCQTEKLLTTKSIQELLRKENLKELATELGIKEKELAHYLNGKKSLDDMPRHLIKGLTDYTEEFLDFRWPTQYMVTSEAFNEIKKELARQDFLDHTIQNINLAKLAFNARAEMTHIAKIDNTQYSPLFFLIDNLNRHDFETLNQLVFMLPVASGLRVHFIIENPEQEYNMYSNHRTNSNSEIYQTIENTTTDLRGVNTQTIIKKLKPFFVPFKEQIYYEISENADVLKEAIKDNSRPTLEAFGAFLIANLNLKEIDSLQYIAIQRYVAECWRHERFKDLLNISNLPKDVDVNDWLVELLNETCNRKICKNATIYSKETIHHVAPIIIQNVKAFNNLLESK